MILISGNYRWFGRRVAFREDFCRSCRAPTVSFGERSFNVRHVYWIPVLPLWFTTHWICERCKSRSHKRASAALWLRILCGTFAAAIAFGAWSDTPEAGEVDAVWVLRFLSLGGLVASGLWIWRYEREPPLKAGLSVIERRKWKECPLCNAPLRLVKDISTCTACGAEHRPLKLPALL